MSIFLSKKKLYKILFSKIFFQFFLNFSILKKRFFELYFFIRFVFIQQVFFLQNITF